MTGPTIAVEQIPEIGHDEAMNLAATEYDRVLGLADDLVDGDWSRPYRLHRLGRQGHARTPARHVRTAWPTPRNGRGNSRRPLVLPNKPVAYHSTK